MKPAHTTASNGLVPRIEQKLDDIVGPPQTPDEPEESTRDIPTSRAIAPGFGPDLVHDSQHYVLEISNYGLELKSILMDIPEPDPDYDSIRSCHRIAAAQKIIDRVLGPAASLQPARRGPIRPRRRPLLSSQAPRRRRLRRDSRRVDRSRPRGHREFARIMRRMRRRLPL